MEKKNIFCWRLEGQWRKEQDQKPDLLVEGTYPRIRIRIQIRTKMSQIRNIGSKTHGLKSSRFRVYLLRKVVKLAIIKKCIFLQYFQQEHSYNFDATPTPASASGEWP